MSWEYRRGKWHHIWSYAEYETAATVALKEWFRKDRLARRWKQFPSLGPVPEKWVNTGPEPGINEVFKVFYLAPVTAMLLEPTSLLRYLDKS